MPDVVLRGCRPEPLGAYLAGVAILRLVAEQRDPAASGAWTEEGFFLTSALDREALGTFLLEDYQPTPLVSPWNKGSGFAPGTASRSAADALRSIEESAACRLAGYRDAIACARRVAPTSPVEFKDKEGIIRRARATLPDTAVEWLDAAVVITSNGVAFPHILGTGGNLGRLDLTANQNAHLAVLIDLGTGAPAVRSAGWLAAVLEGDDTSARAAGAVGQFRPGAAGGVNASTTDGAESRGVVEVEGHRS